MLDMKSGSNRRFIISIPYQGIQPLEVKERPPSTFITWPVVFEDLLKVLKDNLVFLLFWSEEDNSFGNLLNLPDSLEWNIAGCSFFKELVFTLCHTSVSVEVSIECGGWDCIYSYAEWCELQSTGFCEHLKASLSHTVADSSCVGTWTINAGDIDDASLWQW